MALAFGMIAAVIFASNPIDQPWNVLPFGMYNALSHVLWSMAVSYIIFVCVHDIGGPVNWFLSHRCWDLLAKLSYAIYLVHPFIIYMQLTTLQAPLHFSELSAIYNFIGILGLSIFVAIVGTLAFEMPIINIYKSLTTSKTVSNTLTKTKSD